MGSLTGALPVALRLTDEGSLRSYLRQIRDFPLLSFEEEQRLARRWSREGDIDAAHKLVTSHLRLAAKIASGYRGYDLPLSELVSEGNVGLMNAVERFDPERGFRLATYAMWWIRAAIQEHILHSWSLVRLGTTAQQKKLFFNLRRLKGKLEAYEEGDLSSEAVNSIAETLNVPAADVVMMNNRLAGHDRSLNVPLREESDMDWQDWLVDEADDQEVRLAHAEEYAQRRGLLAEALRELTQRERDIIESRRLSEEPLTLEQLAVRHGISRERVRQIEAAVLTRLTATIRRAAARMDGQGAVAYSQGRMSAAAISGFERARLPKPGEPKPTD
jgi:RNA polymerase sigma-32 factor